MRTLLDDFPRFLVFAVIGTAGLVVDVTALYLVLRLGLDHYSGRVISFAVAVTFTWYCNRRLTFAASVRPDPLKEWAHFVAANSTGGLVNFAVYLACLAVLSQSALSPFIAVAFGSLCGLILNFSLSRAFVFRRRRSGHDPEAVAPAKLETSG